MMVGDEALAPRVIRRGMELSILSAVLLSVFTATVSGSVFTGLMRSIHFSAPQIGIMTSVPLLFPLLQVAGAVLQRKFFHRKRFWLVCSLLQTGFYLLLALLALCWWKLPESTGFLIFLGLYALIQTFTQLPASVNLSWLGELVPRRESNAFWNRRTGLASIATMVGGVAIGKLIDVLGREASTTYVTVLVIGIGFSLASILVFSGAADPDPAPRPGEPFGKVLRETWENREYRVLTCFFGYQSLFAWVSSGFIFVFLQAPKGMNFSMLTIQVFLAISALVAFLSGYFFRIVGGKYGRKPVLILCSVLKAFEFVLWATLNPENGWSDQLGTALITKGVALFGWAPPELPPGFIGALPVFLFGGFVNMGIASSQMSLLTSLGNKRIQSLAIALFSAAVGLCGVVTGWFAGYLYDWLDTLTWVQHGWLQTPFNYLALVSAAGYLSSIVILRFFREDGAVGTGEVVRAILSQNAIRGVYQAHLLSQPMTEGGRVETLLRSRSELVADEVIDSLFNPSSRVRDGALLSLSQREGELSPELVRAVVRLLNLPELGMQAMAARTLGRLHVREAVPELVRQVNSGDLALAQASIFALGLLEDRQALPALREALNDENRRELWPLSAEACSKIGDWHETRLLFPPYAVEGYSVLRRQCLIALTRSILPNNAAAHASFEAETKRPGVETERLLRLLCTDIAWSSLPNGAPGFEQLMTLCDHRAYGDCATLLIHCQLRLHGLLEAAENVEEAKAAAQQLAECFAPGGRLRDHRLMSENYPAVNLWLQLKLWAELRYRADAAESGEILLSVALSAAALRESAGKNGGISSFESLRS